MSLKFCNGISNYLFFLTEINNFKLSVKKLKPKIKHICGHSSNIFLFPNFFVVLFHCKKYNNTLKSLYHKLRFKIIIN